MSSREDFDAQRFFAPPPSCEEFTRAEQNDLETIIPTLFTRCVHHYNNSNHQPHRRGTLYHGGLGVTAFLKWKMAVSFYSTDSSSRQQLLESALESTDFWLHSSSHQHDSNHQRCTLLESTTIGALTLRIAILHKLQHRSVEFHTTCHKLERALSQASLLEPQECEVLYGRAGCLHSVLFVRTHGGVPDFGQTLVRRWIDEILRQGKKSRRRPGTLMWTWHGKKYLGAAHGVVGILHTLLHFVPELQQLGLESSSKDQNYFLTLIQQTLDDLSSSFCLDSGNLVASSADNTTDRLVQWCHGAPGHVLLLVRASQVFPQQRQQYLQQAKTLCDAGLVPRGLLRKGLGLCHGIAGNAYCFLAVYRASDVLPTVKGDVLQKAHAFARFGLTHLSDLEHRPDNPYSLYEGMAGFVSLLIDLQERNLDKSFFPCYEYV